LIAAARLAKLQLTGSSQTTLRLHGSEDVMATVTYLLTAEEYMALPDSFDGPTELVKGVLVTMPPARPRHGELCARIAYLLQRFLEDHPRGRIVTNDSAMVTERDPDTVRGPDVAYYSYERAPKGPLPDGLLPVSPDLVFEVRSPSDRWSEIHVKIAEYLQAGVQTVCVLDDEAKRIHAFHAEHGAQAFELNADFALPETLGEFQVPVRRFFE
jgi:Uma2 family endonuclease